MSQIGDRYEATQTVHSLVVSKAGTTTCVNRTAKGRQILIYAILISLLSGCAIANKADNFSAGVDLGVGGILGYIADLRFKAHVDFSESSKETSNAEHEALVDPDPLGISHFL